MNWKEIKKYEERSIHRMTNRCTSVVNDLQNSMKNISETWQAPVQKNGRKQQAKHIPKGGSFLKVLGIVLAGLFGLAAFGGLMELFEAFSVQNLLETILFAAFTGGGVFLAVFGHRRKNKAIKYDSYLKLIGSREAVPIHALSDVLGMDYRDVISDLKEMISRGILSPAWIDMRTYRLMLTPYTEDRPPEKKEEALSRSERILRQIRADNDLIDDEEVSAKIDRIEDLTRKIFAVLDKYPEKEKQLYSFLNYYLPTTLKSLESYARLEAQGVETAAIREAKSKINQILDELCAGYEKQLDRLFENDVVDITADIEVMRRMMQKDGLTESEFSSL